MNMLVSLLQYRHLIPEPVNQTSANAWLHNHPRIKYKKISQAPQCPMQLANQNYVQL